MWPQRWVGGDAGPRSVATRSGAPCGTFVSPLSYPLSETGLIIGVWFLIGIAVLIYLYARHASRLPEMRQVFADEPVTATAVATPGEGA